MTYDARKRHLERRRPAPAAPTDAELERLTAPSPADAAPAAPPAPKPPGKK